jgi:hypothetical protein
VEGVPATPADLSIGAIGSEFVVARQTDGVEGFRTSVLGRNATNCRLACFGDLSSLHKLKATADLLPFAPQCLRNPSPRFLGAGSCIFSSSMLFGAVPIWLFGWLFDRALAFRPSRSRPCAACSPFHSCLGGPRYAACASDPRGKSCPC